MNFAMTRKRVALAGSIVLLLASTGGAEIRHDAKHVPLLRLIATPERFDGVLVRTIGFLWLEFEGDALYLHREDYENGITKQSVWLDLPSAQSAEQRRLRGNYVLVEGVFVAGRSGHLGLHAGEIGKINRLELWSQPGKPRRLVPGS